MSVTYKQDRKRWEVSWREGKKRKREWFVTESEARRYNAGLFKERKQFGEQVWAIGPQQRARWMKWQAVLDERGVSLDSVMDYWLAHAPKEMRSVPLSQAISEFLDDSERTVRRHTLGYYRCNLNQFLRGHPQRTVDSFTQGDIKAYFVPPHLKEKTKMQKWMVLHRFFAWCLEADHRYCATNPAAGIKFKPDEAPVSIWTPSEVAAFLRSLVEHQPNLVPFVAMQLFGGIRREEASRVVPSDFRRTVIDIRGAVAKTRKSRFVEINPVLRAWLDLGGEIPAPPEAARSYRPSVRAAGVPEQRNVLRHCFVSYHLEAFGNAGKTALAAGTSESKVWTNYRERVTREDAEAFWKLTPENVLRPTEQAANVVSLQPLLLAGNVPVAAEDQPHAEGDVAQDNTDMGYCRADVGGL